MTRKLKRTPDFELTLQIKRDDFIAPPRETQRNWLLNRAVAEFSDDLIALDGQAKRFVPGDNRSQLGERTHAQLADDDIMEDWQIPLMQAMARLAAASHGDVLEIGFGRGVSSSFIQELGVASHTIVECNESVVERFNAWRARYPEHEIRLVFGRWQDTLDQLGTYDGVFFHTYPLNEEEYAENVVNSVTFAAHFFPTAAAHLKPGGVFTYMTNEMDSLSRGHQRLLLQHFRAFEASTVKLALPANVRDTWYADSIILVKAVR